MSVNAKNKLAAVITAAAVLGLLAIMQISSTHAAPRGSGAEQPEKAASSADTGRSIPDVRMVEYQ
jgi:hypothetical protein